MLTGRRLLVPLTTLTWPWPRVEGPGRAVAGSSVDDGDDVHDTPDYIRAHSWSCP
jgi:hypothetical protein